jgi:hypothetical protein
MPAPPEIHIQVNKEAFDRACNLLGLKGSVDLRLRPSSRAGITLGDARPGLVTIYYGLVGQEANRLVHVTSQLVRTILHELEHQRQFETWTPKQWAENDKLPYRFQPAEKQANHFADANASSFRDLVRVHRTASSSLGRLARAERSARR